MFLLLRETKQTVAALEYALLKLIERENLSDSEAGAAMSEIMKGEASESLLAAFLTALRLKGESVDELTAFARVMRQHAVRLEPQVEVIDTCGTGGDLLKTFNVSTTTAFVVAGAGVPVAKHGNRAVTSNSGSADVLAALGVNIELGAAQVLQLVEKIGIGFLFAPLFHPAMKYAANVRRTLGFRTVFNLLGPLTNPFGAKRQVMGVYDRSLVPKMARVLANLGCTRGFVVHGLDGIDEVSIIGKTGIASVEPDGTVRGRTLLPEHFGLAQGKAADIAGGNAEQNGRILVSVLKGEVSPRADMVLANASLALVAAGKADDLKPGVELARKSISSGSAFRKLYDLVKLSGGDMGRLAAAGG